MSQGAETALLSLWVFSTQGWDGRGKGRKSRQASRIPRKPFFLITSSLFFPPSLLCEAFQDLSLPAGISGGQPGPQAWTDGQAANQPARTVLLLSALLRCQGLKHGIIHGFWFFFFFLKKIKIPWENIF